MEKPPQHRKGSGTGRKDTVLEGTGDTGDIPMLGFSSEKLETFRELREAYRSALKNESGREDPEVTRLMGYAMAEAAEEVIREGGVTGERIAQDKTVAPFLDSPKFSARRQREAQRSFEELAVETLERNWNRIWNSMQRHSISPEPGEEHRELNKGVNPPVPLVSLRTEEGEINPAALRKVMHELARHAARKWFGESHHHPAHWGMMNGDDYLLTLMTEHAKSRETGAGR